jgi:hypothetical protein
VVKCSASDAKLGGQASLTDDAAASGGFSIQNLHLTPSSCEFDNVDGGTGGRATIEITYASAEHAKIRLIVNDVNCSFLNTPSTGKWDAYTGHASFTLSLKPGKSNTIKIVGGNGGVNISGITVVPIAGG